MRDLRNRCPFQFDISIPYGLESQLVRNVTHKELLNHVFCWFSGGRLLRGDYGIFNIEWSAIIQKSARGKLAIAIVALAESKGVLSGNGDTRLLLSGLVHGLRKRKMWFWSYKYRLNDVFIVMMTLCGAYYRITMANSETLRLEIAHHLLPLRSPSEINNLF